MGQARTCLHSVYCWETWRWLKIFPQRFGTSLLCCKQPRANLRHKKQWWNTALIAVEFLFFLSNHGPKVWRRYFFESFKEIQILDPTLKRVGIPGNWLLSEWKGVWYTIVCVLHWQYLWVKPDSQTSIFGSLQNHPAFGSTCSFVL